MTHIKVLTLNIWDVGESLDRRNALLASGLKRLQPDIVCLQEVSRLPPTQPIRSELFAAPCGFDHHIFSGLGESGIREAGLPRNMEGLSILSRFPALRQESVALPYFAGDVPRQILLAEFAIGQSRIAVATTHLAFPPTFSSEREVQMQRALDAVDRFAAQADIDAIILTGDLNDEPGSSAVQTILGSRHGFRDAYAACHPDDPGATFTSATNSGLMFLVLDDFEERHRKGQTIDKIAQEVRRRLAEIEEAQAFVFIPPPVRGMGAAAGFSMRLQDTLGMPSDEFARITQEFVAEVNRTPGIAKSFIEALARAALESLPRTGTKPFGPWLCPAGHEKCACRTGAPA